ncbi:undecaprenyl-diphosphate phosphatase [Candidatus Woesearchaeota archaeon]|nr:undecaprenyl-diphosphate phosphatase [Candidatus Woesearchaeota archaeon]
MATLFEAILLGIIQGVTEWLPISSSGHLVLAQHLLGLQEPVVFDVVLHFGSLLVILMVYWKDLIELLFGVFRRDMKVINYVLMLIVASVPIAFVGIFLNDLIKSAFNSTKIVGISLLITSVLLFLSRYVKKKKTELNFVNTLVIGFAQALAILPGVSRSGSTISTGLIQGVEKEEAAKFSFLMAMPAILGANLLEIRHLGEITNLPLLGVATLTTIITGYVSLRLLLHIIRKDWFHKFGWYCLVMGLVVLLFL